MKVKIPHAAITRKSSIYTNRMIIKINRCCGWDIADHFAIVNDMTVPQIGKLCNMQVYSDHIIIDTDSIE